MKALSAVALAAGLLLGTSALAEEHHDHGGHPNNGGGSAQYQSHGSQGSQGSGNWQRGGQNWQRGGQNWQRSGNWQSRGNAGGNTQVESWHGGNWQQNGSTFRQDRSVQDRRADWNGRNRNWGENRNFRASHQFHFGTYRRPDGWYYRRWSYGEYLPAAFWTEDYWLNDWSQFDLPQPPYGCEWVRYGNDALLINIYSGQIVEVEYDVFY